MTERVRVDRYVGSRIRLQRISLGMTDEHLAEIIGVSAAEMEHYEEGASGCLQVCCSTWRTPYPSV